MSNKVALYRWRHVGMKGRRVSIGDMKDVQIDEDGLLPIDLTRNAEEKLRRMSKPGGYEYVPMSNEAIWETKIAEARQAIDKAKAAADVQRRSLVEAVAYQKRCEEALASLEAEQLKYEQALDDATKPESDQAAA